MSVTLGISGGVGMKSTGVSTQSFTTLGQTKIQIPVNFVAQQIAGLALMTPCNAVDCRVTSQRWCYSLPVFGTFAQQPASYQNDWNTFLVNFSGSGTPKFTLQKLADSFFSGKEQVSIWNNVADISNNGLYGTLYPLGSLAIPTYMMFQINWGSVVAVSGPGYYRIVFQSCITNIVTGTGQVQAQSSNTPFETPYLIAGAPGAIGYPPVPWATVSSIQMAITITCGTKVYTVPSFMVSPITSAAEMTVILSTINALTGANFPFTAIAASSPNNTTEFYFQGTNYAAQNGCSVKIVYTYFDAKKVEIESSRITSGPAILTGGNNGTNTTTTTCTCGLQSPQFRLWAWDCMKAHGTTKFEVWNTGTLGDVNNPGVLQSLCGITVYDSIRVNGFFGYGKYSYDEILQEYGISTNALFGTIERVRDKAIPAYKWNSQPLPAWVHKQLASVMMMADTVLASDYNINNADYLIQRKQVVKKGGYEPKYKEKGKKFDLSLQEFGRRDPVSVEFLEGIQSLIKTTICQTT